MLNSLHGIHNTKGLLVEYRADKALYKQATADIQQLAVKQGEILLENRKKMSAANRIQHIEQFVPVTW